MSELNRRTAESEVFENYLLFHQFVRGQQYRLDFVAVRIAAWESPEGPPSVYEHVPDGTQNWNCTDPAEADIFLQGDIKFDGEMNLDFPNVSKCMLQFGDVRDATGLGRLIERIYLIAAERLPHTEGDQYFRLSADSST